MTWLNLNWSNLTWSDLLDHVNIQKKNHLKRSACASPNWTLKSFSTTQTVKFDQRKVEIYEQLDSTEPEILKNRITKQPHNLWKLRPVFLKSDIFHQFLSILWTQCKNIQLNRNSGRGGNENKKKVFHKRISNNQNATLATQAR